MDDFKVDIDSIPIVLTVQDISKILFIGRNSAYRLIKEGQIKSFRIGTTIRVTRNALMEYLQQASGNPDYK